MLIPAILTISAAASEPFAALADEAWLDLDREINALATSFAREGEAGLSWSAYIITTYVNTSDAVFSGGPEDLSGIVLRRARIDARGGVGDLGFKISTGLENGEAELLDAYVSHQLCGNSRILVGRFRQPLFSTGLRSTKFNLFYEREFNGAENNARDLGVQLRGDLMRFHWWVALQNGFDSQADSALMTGRLEYDLVGNPFNPYEGAWMAPEGMNAGLAIAGAEDGGIENGSVGAAEVELSRGPLYFGVTVASYDEFYDQTAGFADGRDPDALLGQNLADRNPFSFTISYLFSERYEWAVRYESLEDDQNTGRFSAALHRYDPEFGPLSQWALNWVNLSSDDPTLEGSRFELGVTLGIDA